MAARTGKTAQGASRDAIILQSVLLGYMPDAHDYAAPADHNNDSAGQTGTLNRWQLNKNFPTS